MRPPATATALAVGRSGSMVSTFALTRSKSASYGMPQDPIRRRSTWAGPDRNCRVLALNPGSAISVCQGESPRCDGWWPAVIDRAEDGDGDAVGAARHRPAGGERADTSSIAGPRGA